MNLTLCKVRAGMNGLAASHRVLSTHPALARYTLCEISDKIIHCSLSVTILYYIYQGNYSMGICLYTPGYRSTPCFVRAFIVDM